MTNIKLSINNITINFFEDKNETLIDRLIRLNKNISILEYNPADTSVKYKNLLNIRSSVIQISEEKLNIITITTPSGTSTLTKCLLELSDIDKIPLIIEPFTISKNDEYYKIIIDLGKFNFNINLEKASTVEIDSTCWFEPSLIYQGNPLININRDLKINNKGYALLNCGDIIKLFDTDASGINDKIKLDTVSWQTLNYMSIKTVTTPNLTTTINNHITLDKSALNQLIKLFKLSPTKPIHTELGTLQYIDNIITLTYTPKDTITEQ